MERYDFRHDGQTWRRVSKSRARRHYEAGRDVVIVPHRMVPFGGWGLGYRISKLPPDDTSAKSFDDVVQSYEWYSCNSETGYYAAFYVADGGKV